MCPSQSQCLQRLLYQTHNAPSEAAQTAEPQGWCERCEGALTQVSYGEIEMVVDAVFLLFFLCCITCTMTLHMKDLQYKAASPWGKSLASAFRSRKECQQTFTAVWMIAFTNQLLASLSRNAEYYAHESEYFTYASEDKTIFHATGSWNILWTC